MQNILSVQSLTKKFDDFTAVKDISFNVEIGSIFAFLGPNGAGKSTTIKMLTTVLKPTSGKISINGFNVLKEQDKARASFGIVFQDSSLDEELTAYENIVYHGIWHNWFLLGISPESPNHSSYSRCGDSAAEQIRVHSTEG